MKNVFEQKGIYKPRFRGYYLFGAILEIINGVLTIFSLPFGYICILHFRYLEYNIMKDYKRRKQNRQIRDDCMKIWEYKEDVSNNTP